MIIKHIHNKHVLIFTSTYIGIHSDNSLEAINLAGKGLEIYHAFRKLGVFKSQCKVFGMLNLSSFLDRIS